MKEKKLNKKKVDGIFMFGILLGTALIGAGIGIKASDMIKRRNNTISFTVNTKEAYNVYKDHFSDRVSIAGGLVGEHASSENVIKSVKEVVEKFPNNEFDYIIEARKD